MNQSEFALMLGDWIGTGEMTVGPLTGTIEEYMRIGATDLSDCVSYVRKSRIVFPGRVTLHDELGYLKPEWIGLFLSRGSHIVLEWDVATSSFAQTHGSEDSRNMVRAIAFPAPAQMLWDNRMEVRTDRGWMDHTASTRFTSVSRLHEDQADAADTFMLASD